MQTDIDIITQVCTTRVVHGHIQLLPTTRSGPILNYWGLRFAFNPVCASNNWYYVMSLLTRPPQTGASLRLVSKPVHCSLSMCTSNISLLWNLIWLALMFWPLCFSVFNINTPLSVEDVTTWHKSFRSFMIRELEQSWKWHPHVATFISHRRMAVWAADFAWENMPWGHICTVKKYQLVCTLQEANWLLVKKSCPLKRSSRRYDVLRCHSETCWSPLLDMIAQAVRCLVLRCRVLRWEA